VEHAFCGNRDVQIGQSTTAGGNQIHIHRKVFFGVAERFDAPEGQASGCFQERSDDASVEVFHEKEVQLPAVSPSQDLTISGKGTGSLEGAEREIVQIRELLHDLEHL